MIFDSYDKAKIYISSVDFDDNGDILITFNKDINITYETLRRIISDYIEHSPPVYIKRMAEDYKHSV